MANISTFVKNLYGFVQTKAMLKGILWTFVGVFVSKGFVFLSMFFIARFMSVEEFGKIGILQSYMSTFMLLSLASFGVTATKYLALYGKENPNKASEVFSIIRLLVWGLSFVIFSVSIIFAKDISILLINDVSLSTEIALCATAIFFSSLNGLQIGALSGLESFKNVSVVNIVNGILSLPLIVFFVYNMGVWGFAVSVSITNFSIWLCSSILLKRELKYYSIKFTTRKIKQHFDILYSFSLPAFLSSLMVAPTILICNAMLVREDGGGYEMGIYNAANNFYNISVILLGVVGNVFYPYAMKNFGKGNKKFDFINIVNSFYVALVIGLPIICLPEISTLLFGNQYNNKIMNITTALVVVFTIINAQKMGVARNFAAGNFMWFSVVSNGVWSIAAIFFTYLLVSYGAVGRGVAFCVAYGINTLIFVPYFIKNKLIDKELIFTKYNLYFILLVGLAILVSFMNVGISVRMLFTVSSLIVISLLTLRWFNSYTGESLIKQIKKDGKSQ